VTAQRRQPDLEPAPSARRCAPSAPRATTYWSALIGSEGKDTLRSLGGTQQELNGGVGDDKLTGGASDDPLLGGNGRDILDGLDGGDTLDGGFDGDIIDGGTVVDSGSRGDTVDYSGRSASVNVDLKRTDPSHGGTDEGDTITDVENVRGGRGDDTLQGNSAGNALIGNRGNDVLVGTRVPRSSTAETATTGSPATGCLASQWRTAPSTGSTATAVTSTSAGSPSWSSRPHHHLLRDHQPGLTLPSPSAWSSQPS
jgi:Ca2+-binding RTX toxin-like protein